MREVVFIEDFATKLKGDVFECDAMMASHLVHIDKVAIYKDEDFKPKKLKAEK